MRTTKKPTIILLTNIPAFNWFNFTHI